LSFVTLVNFATEQEAQSACAYPNALEPTAHREIDAAWASLEPRWAQWQAAFTRR
jgi:hypothetical protein